MGELQPINVLLTGAAGQIAYSLAFNIAKGEVFGPNQPVNLILLDIPPMAGVLEGVVMELQDCALPLLRKIVPTTDEPAAFKDVDAAFLVGSMPRREGMERKDLLQANVKIFKSQGQNLDKHAKKTVKVLVVGNPANTNCLICSKYAPSLNKENFSAMTRLDQNRAQSQLAIKLGIPADHVKNVIIWGNHSSTQFPDASQAVARISQKEVKVKEAIKDDHYLRDEFVSIIQKRGASVISARKASSAASAAKAAGDHMRDWWLGTEGRIVSMGVYSKGEYGSPADVIFSFPVTIQNKTWKIVEGLELDDFAKQKLKVTGKELEEERADALAVCQD